MQTGKLLSSSSRGRRLKDTTVSRMCECATVATWLPLLALCLVDARGAFRAYGSDARITQDGPSPGGSRCGLAELIWQESWALPLRLRVWVFARVSERSCIRCHPHPRGRLLHRPTAGPCHRLAPRNFRDERRRRMAAASWRPSRTLRSSYEMSFSGVLPVAAALPLALYSRAPPPTTAPGGRRLHWPWCRL